MDIKSSRMQVIGIRSGAPLTGDAEGDDIVYALMKIRGLLPAWCSDQYFLNHTIFNRKGASSELYI